MDSNITKGLFACVVFFGTLFLFGGLVSALEISVEPATAQREIGGKVRIHVYANGATDLISMGVKVTFDPAVLQVVEAKKFEKDAQGNIVWLMDGDGDPATTEDQYSNPAVEIDNENGTVTMIGGRLTGTSTQGLSGKVLLGWIVFDAVGNGTTSLTVDLAKYGPGGPANKTFDNFVTVSAVVDEPINVPNQLGVICVLDEACNADINENGYVDPGDFAILRASMGKAFPDPSYDVSADLNANGYVDPGDFAILRTKMGTTCAPCP